jgi:hypothetical protein
MHLSQRPLPVHQTSTPQASPTLTPSLPTSPPHLSSRRQPVRDQGALRTLHQASCLRTLENLLSLAIGGNNGLYDANRPSPIPPQPPGPTPSPRSLPALLAEP